MTDDKIPLPERWCALCGQKLGSAHLKRLAGTVLWAHLSCTREEQHGTND